ncbi:MAG: hypothetical protein LBD14_00010 [Puniceicoccales bacterium]|jgi:hypothetical protein|nr:hypothetical protein [Puniceicoccales bacterium]
MQILERIFRSERTMKAVFGLGSEKFDELAGRMEILYIEKFNREVCAQLGACGAFPREDLFAQKGDLFLC